MNTTTTTTREGIIYKYTSPNGKIYIGQTIDEKKRKSTHKRDSETSTSKFHTAIRQHGYNNFIYEVLYSIKGTKEEIKTILDEKELYYIKLNNSAFDGYNSTNGNKFKTTYLDYHGYSKQSLIDEAFMFCNGDFNGINTPNYWNQLIINNYYLSLDYGYVCYYIYDEKTDTVRLKASLKNVVNNQPRNYPDLKVA